MEDTGFFTGQPFIMILTIRICVVSKPTSDPPGMWTSVYLDTFSFLLKYFNSFCCLQPMTYSLWYLFWYFEDISNFQAVDSTYF